MAIIPIASLIVEATEHIAVRTGDAIGGLLNATFGNAPELIIAVVALKAGLFDMVRASLIGAILANLLLAQGVAFFLGGLRYHNQEYNAGATRLYSTMMLIAVISLVVPSAFSRFFSSEATMRQEQFLNLGMAFVLLIAYGLYLLFHAEDSPEIFSAAGGQEEEHHEGEQWGLPRAVGSLLIASVLAAWMSEILVGAAEGTGKALGMSQTFIGIVFLAIVGGAAESGSAIAMARKNKLDLTVGIALGSCIQIALFVAPALVLLSYARRPAAAGAFVRQGGAWHDVPRRFDRRDGVGGWAIELVQGRAAHHGVRHHGLPILFHARGGATMNVSAVIGTGGLRKLRRPYLRQRYTILFYTLLLTMVAAPVFDALEFPGVLIESLLAANLLAAVLPVSDRRGRSVLLALMFLVWLARSAIAWLEHPALSAMTLGIWTVIGLLAAALALRFAMRAASVDAEHLYAALSAYLLAGIFFGLFYWVLEQSWPGTFAFPGKFSRATALYFSFVTLATLGYGDIVPRTDVARGLAIVEGVGGQLFLAVMVARLVSLYGRGEPGARS